MSIGSLRFEREFIDDLSLAKAEDAGVDVFLVHLIACWTGLAALYRRLAEADRVRGKIKWAELSEMRTTVASRDAARRAAPPMATKIRE